MTQIPKKQRTVHERLDTIRNALRLIIKLPKNKGLAHAPSEAGLDKELAGIGFTNFKEASKDPILQKRLVDLLEKYEEMIPPFLEYLREGYLQRREIEKIKEFGISGKEVPRLPANGVDTFIHILGPQELEKIQQLFEKIHGEQLKSAQKNQEKVTVPETTVTFNASKEAPPAPMVSNEPPAPPPLAPDPKKPGLKK